MLKLVLLVGLLVGYSLREVHILVCFHEYLFGRASGIALVHNPSGLKLDDVLLILLKQRKVSNLRPLLVYVYRRILLYLLFAVLYDPLVLLPLRLERKKGRLGLRLIIIHRLCKSRYLRVLRILEQDYLRRLFAKLLYHLLRLEIKYIYLLEGEYIFKNLQPVAFTRSKERSIQLTAEYRRIYKCYIRHLYYVEYLMVGLRSALCGYVLVSLEKIHVVVMRRMFPVSYNLVCLSILFELHGRLAVLSCVAVNDVIHTILLGLSIKSIAPLSTAARELLTARS